MVLVVDNTNKMVRIVDNANKQIKVDEAEAY